MNILVASQIDPAALSALTDNHVVTPAVNASEEVLQQAIIDSEIVIFRSGVQLSADVLKKGRNLSLLLRAGSGLDNVDVEYAREHGLRIVRIAGSSSQPVAEFTFALMLGAARNVVYAHNKVAQGHWPKSQLGGPLLTGKTLGIVGTGKIGTRVGELGSSWGMNAIGCVKNPSSEVASDLEARGVRLTSFDEVVSEADFLCIHTPLNDSTRHLIDEGVMANMKPGSFLINLARGGVVDEDALYNRLEGQKTLVGAALDVHEREGEGIIPRLAELPNVVLTPHIGAMAWDAQRAIGTRMIELVDAYARGAFEQVVQPSELVT